MKSQSARKLIKSKTLMNMVYLQTANEAIELAEDELSEIYNSIIKEKYKDYIPKENAVEAFKEYLAFTNVEYDEGCRVLEVFLEKLNS